MCCICLLAFLLSCLGVRREKVEAVPTGTGEPHVLAGERTKRDMGEQGAGREMGYSGAAVQGLAYICSSSTINIGYSIEYPRIELGLPLKKSIFVCSLGE